MDYINYVKQSPLAGFAGFGGGAPGLAASGIKPLRCTVESYTNVKSWGGDRAIFGWGNTSVNVNSYKSSIDYFTITNCSDSTDFGEPYQYRGEGRAAGSNKTRVTSMGGYTNTFVDTIDYVTVATTGNANNFGDCLTENYNRQACSDGTYSIFYGGARSSPWIQKLEYITVASTGNSSQFCTLPDSNLGNGQACSNGTRGVMSGSATTNMIRYFTFGTSGSASGFGNLTQRRYAGGGADNTVRGCFFGGNYSEVYDIIDYITIDTTGNATDFGDLEKANYSVCATDNGTRAVVIGGYSQVAGRQDAIQFVEVATTSDAAEYAEISSGSESGSSAASGT